MPQSKKDKEKEIEREIRRRQGFSIGRAIEREGGDYLKGASPVPRQVRAEAVLLNFVVDFLRDTSGALRTTLQKAIANDEVRVSEHLDDPVVALEVYLDNMLENENVLYEFVSRVDTEWGRIFFERPHFQRPDQAPHPDDEYTHESVRRALSDLLVKAKEYGGHL